MFKNKKWIITLLIVCIMAIFVGIILLNKRDKNSNYDVGCKTSLGELPAEACE